MVVKIALQHVIAGSEGVRGSLKLIVYALERIGVGAAKRGSAISLKITYSVSGLACPQFMGSTPRRQ